MTKDIVIGSLIMQLGIWSMILISACIFEDRIAVDQLASLKNVESRYYFHIA